MKKKVVLVGIVAAMTFGMSVTAFAAGPGNGRSMNRESRVTAGAGFNRQNGWQNGEMPEWDSIGLGQGGPGRALGSGGMMLQDGSCFVVQP